MKINPTDSPLVIFIKQRFQFKKMRIIFAWLGGFILILNADINSDGFRVGVPIAIIGELIRLWASGYLEKKGKLFACGGPFAFVRNPLYVGNFLVGLGVAFVIGRLWILAVYVIGFIVLYAGTVRKEEEELSERFGEPYRKYLREVPRFIPRLTPYADRQKTPFNWQLILKHREYVTIIFLVVLFLGLYLWQALFVLREPVSQHIPAAVIEAIFLALAAFEKFFRKKIDKLVQ